MAELLVVPLKSSTDVDIVKPLKNIIQTTYSSENTEDYTDALNELARLRSNAIWKVFEKSSLEVIYSYYDQLVSLESKIPPQEVQIPFKWKDAFDKGSIFGGRRSLTVSSLAYERMCVLFNMAAMQSAVAASQALDTEEALRLSTKMLQQAAGIFDYLKANIMMAVHQDTTPDLHPDTLGALSLLMLAQAQEVVVYKCIKDEMKEGMVAKVAAQCEELYTDALRALTKDHLKPLWERDWISTVTGKQLGFRAMAQFQQSLVCRHNKAYGEEIARLRLACDLFAAARDRLPPAALALREPAARAARHLAAAVKDNDFIYHERVPDAAALEPVSRAPVARALAPPARWSAESARDPFAALLPVRAAQALAASAARCGEATAAEVGALREATHRLNAELAARNLPAAVETSRGERVPDSLRERARAVRAAGGAAALRRLLAELPELLQRNREVLDEAERMLREEAEADDALRRQFGARWTRTQSAPLTEAFRANADKYRQIIDNAVRADQIVQDKFKQHEKNIELLSGSEEEFEAGVPGVGGGGGSGGEEDAGAVRELRALMEEVAALKEERERLEEELKAFSLDVRGEVVQAVARDGGVDEAALTARVLGPALEPLRGRARASLRRQEELLARVVRAAEGLRGAGAAEGRDAALGALAAAHDAHQELQANLSEGVKFYNDLTQLLVTFQNKVSDFCFARKTEKEELLKDLTQDAARAAQRPAPAPPSHHQRIDEPDVSVRTPPPRPPPPTVPAAAAAGAALPYPMQAQGMPQPYAQPYLPTYAPPMPAAYNPYATMPYPRSAPLPPAPAGYLPYQYPPHSAYPQQPPGYNPYPQPPSQ